MKIVIGPVPTWYGITVTDTRVTEINLAGNNLKGTIPSSLGNLVNLTYLNLGSDWFDDPLFNRLTGSIPSSIGNLINLQSLDLDDNLLSGGIPPSLGNLLNLTNLELNGNQLSDSIPSSLGNLVNLTRLHLWQNQLSGSIPSSIGNLVNLWDLWLRENQLSGSIPSSLGNLVNLGRLELEVNQFSGSIPSSLGNLVNLNTLNLSYNSLSDSIPSSLGNLVNLSELTLGHNQLSGSIPSSVGNLVNLTSWSLYVNEVSGRIPSSIGNLVNLTFLQLAWNQLSDTIPASIGNLVNLRYLYLNSNQLSDTIPASIGNLVNLITEGSLNLSSNRFTFESMELIAQTLPAATYSPQAAIPVYQNGNALSVSAGGTLSNNTYNWYKDGLLNTTIYGDSIFTPIANGSYSVAVTNTIATQLTLYSDTVSAVLPVTLLNFTATGNGKVNVLKWTTSEEVNTTHFNIERSSDGSIFNKIGTVLANVTGATNAYQYSDQEPLTGINYYRLQIVDKDGYTEYSPIRTANGDAIVSRLYPNPATNQITITFNSDKSQSAQIEVITLNGKRQKVMQVVLTPGINTQIIALNNLVSGSYVVRMTSAGGEILLSEKLLKH